MDAISQSRLTGLHPQMIQRYTQIDSLLDANGVFIRLTDGLRTFAQQAADYARGRTTPGNRITDAPPGHSWHQYGMAFDCCVLLNGGVDYDITTPQWKKIYALAPTCGLFCGINFPAGMKGDDDHFQLQELPMSPTADDVALLVNSGIQAVWEKYFPLGESSQT